MATGDDNGMPTDRSSPGLGGYFSRNPWHWFTAAASVGVVGALVGGIVLVSGLLDIGAYTPHADGWAHMLHFAFGRYVAAHEEKSTSPEPLDSRPLIATGASIYANECANCHGAPGLGQNPVALSMRPEPPPLDKAAEKYTPGELFTIVHRGVAYNAMPAWPAPNRPDEVWALVAFLEHWKELDAQGFRDLAGLPAPAPASPEAQAIRDVPSPAPDLHRPYMPGDPQDPFHDAATTQMPRTGMAPFGATNGQDCAMCHGKTGEGRADNSVPRLDTQDPAYLYASLRAYATGHRRSGVMWPYAANLSDAEMRQYAVDYGAKPGHAPAPQAWVDPPADAALIARGQEIAARGLPGGAACNSCHGIEGQSGSLVPSIAGQNPVFLRNQLRVMRDDARGATGGYNPMAKEVHGATDEDIQALAAWYASLPPRADLAAAAPRVLQ
jgi:cytochrome c553